MKIVRVINCSTGKSIFDKVFLTESFKDRFLGLMFKKLPIDFDALIIDKCTAVHSFFMRFDIDLIFLNREKVVIDIEKGLKPYRVSNFVKDSYYVIETVSNKTALEKFSVGDIIDFVPSQDEDKR